MKNLVDQAWAEGLFVGIHVGFSISLFTLLISIIASGNVKLVPVILSAFSFISILLYGRVK